MMTYTFVQILYEGISTWLSFVWPRLVKEEVKFRYFAELGEDL